MPRSLPVNISQLARENNVHRSTLERVLSGETKNPRQKTVQILEKAGLLPSSASLLIPGNVRAFGQQLPLEEVERLMRVQLKPVSLMTSEELGHLLESMRRFPTLYHWHGEERARDS